MVGRIPNIASCGVHHMGAGKPPRGPLCKGKAELRGLNGNKDVITMVLMKSPNRDRNESTPVSCDSAPPQLPKVAFPVQIVKIVDENAI